jgi:hypothetical protein
MAAAVAAVALVAPSVARADLAACKKAYDDQSFDEVQRICGAVAREPLAERAEVTTALEVMGMASLVLGRERPARVAFCQLLVVEPGYRPTDPIYPQRFVAVFDATRSGGCPPALRLEIEAASVRERAAVLVRVKGTLPAVSRIGVFYRRAGDKRWRRELAPGAQSATVELPKASLAEGGVEVFATILIDDDYAVARAGTADRPLRLARLVQVPVIPPRPERRSTPVWQRSWFWWTVAGVAATVVIVSASVVAGGSHGPRGSLDTLHLPLRLTWR